MDTVEQIKAKLSIVDVVGAYVKLTRSGRNYKGLSPFNKEKTPSFYVNPERGTYYCFSSSQGGDHFDFIQKMEGVDFKGALKILADKAGIEITYSNTSGVDKDKRDRLFEAMTRAEAYFAENLVQGKDVPGSAYAYARSRGLSDETIKEWNLGYSKDTWRDLLETLTAAGFTNAELEAAGLIKEADEKKGTWYDRFRGRLMFPIRDAAGRTVAFTGRALNKDEAAKYLNSPETLLYKKSEILFGMDKAKDAIRTRGFALLVEGQMDLLHLHQIGFKNAIALSGTALTNTHLALMKRYADNLMLALDADRAGLAAAQKSAIAALGAGMRVKAVRMPAGKDPADLALEDPKGLSNRIKDAESIVEFFLTTLAEGERDSHRLVIAAEETVLPLIRAIQSPLEREHFVGVAARALSLAPEAVRASVGKGSTPQPSSSVQTPRTEAARVAPDTRKPSTRMSNQLRAIAAAYPGSLLAERVQSEYTRIIGAPIPDEPPPESLIFEAGIALGEAPGEAAANDLITTFERTHLAERLHDATARLRLAEASRDMAQVALISAECQNLAKRLAEFS